MAFAALFLVNLMLRRAWIVIWPADLPDIPWGRHNAAWQEIGFRVGNAVSWRSSEDGRLITGK